MNNIVREIVKAQLMLLVASMLDRADVRIVKNGDVTVGKVLRVELEDGSGHNYNVQLQANACGSNVPIGYKTFFLDLSVANQVQPAIKIDWHNIR